jgi:hypothetical protein
MSTQVETIDAKWDRRLKELEQEKQYREQQREQQLDRVMQLFRPFFTTVLYEQVRMGETFRI